MYLGLCRKRYESLKVLTIKFDSVGKSSQIWSNLQYLRSTRNAQRLGIAGWNDKLIQEVIRVILSAYDERMRYLSAGVRQQAYLWLY